MNKSHRKSTVKSHPSCSTFLGIEVQLRAHRSLPASSTTLGPLLPSSSPLHSLIVFLLIHKGQRQPCVKAKLTLASLYDVWKIISARPTWTLPQYRAHWALSRRYKTGHLVRDDPSLGGLGCHRFRNKTTRPQHTYRLFYDLYLQCTTVLNVPRS